MATSNNTIPYDKIDIQVRELVRVLNQEYPHITTVGSCEGHKNPKLGQWDADKFYVTFSIKQHKLGWRVLEFLAWAINKDYARGGHTVQLIPSSYPPFLNTPGECLFFAIEGFNNESPDDLAKFLLDVRHLYS